MIAADASTRGPVKELFGDARYRNFWFSQVLYNASTGTLRFAFVWLVVTLTEWPSAEGLVAICLGLPPMFLSVPAGAWADRMNRKTLYMISAGVNLAALVVFTAVVAAGWATPVLTGAAALVIGATSTVNLPNLQAIVPLVVDDERLMNAVALQNGGAQAAQFLGLLGAGAAIAVFGDWAGFGLITVLLVASIVFMVPVELPDTDGVATVDDDAERIGRQMLDGARFALGADPLRTLLVLSLILGASFAVMQISVPRVVEDVFENDSTTAGLILGAFGLGMLVSSFAISGRETMHHGRNVALFIGVGLGLGQFTLSFAPNRWIAIVIMVCWGLNAGVAMASHRTLLQTEAPPEMFGRVMGLMMFGFAGSLPIGALVSTLLAPAVGPVNTMRIVGACTICITIPLTWRRRIIELR